MNISLSKRSINQAFLSAVLHELGQGHWAACRALGVPDHLLMVFRRLNSDQISRLSYSPVNWLKFQIDEEAFTRISELHQESDEAEIERALQLGASSQMMFAVFGLTHEETAYRRRLMKIEVKNGRIPVLTEEQQSIVWQEWEAFKTANATFNPQDKLRLSMKIAEQHGLSLSHVWGEITACEEGNEYTIT